MTPLREIGTLLKNKIYHRQDAKLQNVSSPNIINKITQDKVSDFLSGVCHKRKERRQVLFALGKQGGKHKPPRYKLESLVRC